MGPYLADLDVTDRLAIIRPCSEDFTSVRPLRTFQVSFELSAGQWVAEERRAPVHEISLSRQPRYQSIEVLNTEANEIDTGWRCGPTRHRQILVQAPPPSNQRLGRGRLKTTWVKVSTSGLRPDLCTWCARGALDLPQSLSAAPRTPRASNSRCGSPRSETPSRPK